MALHQPCQGFLDSAIIFGLRLILVSTSGQLYDLTGSADTALLFCHQKLSSLSFLSRPYNFFSIKAFIARFSNSSSPTSFL